MFAKQYADAPIEHAFVQPIFAICMNKNSCDPYFHPPESPGINPLGALLNAEGQHGRVQGYVDIFTTVDSVNDTVMEKNRAFDSSLQLTTGHTINEHTIDYSGREVGPFPQGSHTRHPKTPITDRHAPQIKNNLGNQLLRLLSPTPRRHKMGIQMHDGSMPVANMPCIPGVNMATAFMHGVEDPNMEVSPIPAPSLNPTTDEPDTHAPIGRSRKMGTSQHPPPISPPQRRNGVTQNDFIMATYDSPQPSPMLPSRPKKRKHGMIRRLFSQEGH